MALQSNRPTGNYVSRRGEHPSTVVEAITKKNPDQVAVVLVRAANGMSSVSRHYLAGIRDHEAIKDLQENKYMTPQKGAQATAVTSLDILELTRPPKWDAQNGLPFVRVGTWELKLDSFSDIVGPVETFLRNISDALGDEEFNKWAKPKDGGVATMPLIVIEVPGFENEIVDRVRELLESVDGSQGTVAVVDTRSFDREHLLEHFRRYFPDAKKAPLDESATVNKILDDYDGSAELVLRLVSDAKRSPTDENGKCKVPLHKLFEKAAPQFSHLLPPQHPSMGRLR